MEPMPTRAGATALRLQTALFEVRQPRLAHENAASAAPARPISIGGRSLSAAFCPVAGSNDTDSQTKKFKADLEMSEAGRIRFWRGCAAEVCLRAGTQVPLMALRGSSLKKQASPFRSSANGRLSDAQQENAASTSVGAGLQESTLSYVCSRHTQPSAARTKVPISASARRPSASCA